MDEEPSVPLVTGNFLADLLKEVRMDCRELAVAVLWRPSRALLEHLVESGFQTAYRWAWEYGPCTTRAREIRPAEEERVLLACTQWCWHWGRRGPRLICDPLWERKGNDVLDFLRGKIGKERFRTLRVEHLSRDDVDRSAHATYTPGQWSMYERCKHALDDYWEDVGPEVLFDEPLYWCNMSGELEIVPEEHDRERKAGRRGQGPEDEPPDEGGPVKMD